MDEKKLRQTSGSSATSDTNSLYVAGTGTVESAEVVCGCPQPGPETIEVEQVLGAQMAQRVVEFDMIVPDPKPDIEQVIDVYVKDVCIRSVDVIRDKVIVRGELEVKVMYVADLPDQPVHAFERDHVRWTRDIVIEGTEKDMKATADVTVEFIDYDFNCHHDRRKVHITIVIKVWARVVTTTEMDVYALTPIDEVGEVETLSASASGAGETITSASQFAGYGVENVFITGPGITPTAGTSTTVSGTATVTGNSVNVRTGPGTNFPVVTKVNRGTVVTLRDSAFGWYRVVLPDGSTTGWIAAWLLNLGTTTPTTPMG